MDLGTCDVEVKPPDEYRQNNGCKIREENSVMNNIMDSERFPGCNNCCIDLFLGTNV